MTRWLSYLDVIILNTNNYCYIDDLKKYNNNKNLVSTIRFFCYWLLIFFTFIVLSFGILASHTFPTRAWQFRLVTSEPFSKNNNAMGDNTDKSTECTQSSGQTYQSLNGLLWIRTPKSPLRSPSLLTTAGDLQLPVDKTEQQKAKTKTYHNSGYNHCPVLNSCCVIAKSGYILNQD